jgi:putative intracellular protease/amidase
MKRYIIISMILVSMVLCVALVHAEPGPKVLLIPREGHSGDLELMLTKEVGLMVAILEKAGFEVDVATALGVPIAASTTTLRPDLKLADVKVDDYAGFILACMAVGLFPGQPQPAEKPVAAQLGAVCVLAEAGVLKGKRYAFIEDPLNRTYGPGKDVRFTGAIYSGSGVVKDGNIITSGACPYAVIFSAERDETAELTNALVAELKKK